MKPILPFKAVEGGKVYPTLFETDKELPAEMEPIALDLGCLSDEDAQAVRDRLRQPTNNAARRSRRTSRNVVPVVEAAAARKRLGKLSGCSRTR